VEQSAQPLGSRTVSSTATTAAAAPTQPTARAQPRRRPTSATTPATKATTAGTAIRWPLADLAMARGVASMYDPSRRAASRTTTAALTASRPSSGSVISDLDNPNHKDTGEKPQTDALGDDVSLVTLTLGGNDLGFADVVQDCILNGESNVPFLASCQEKHNQRIAQRLPELRRELLAAYQEIHQKSPDARIVVVGYPQLFVDDPSDRVGDLLFAQDQRWMNQKAADLNAMLASAAKETGAEFVDPTDTFRGHGIGSSDPWINDLEFGGPGWMVHGPGSFHPNATGHAALAQLIQQQLEHPRS
jgi:lysophospholipase L1-like esterase